jgi:hypothetical protein
MSTATTPAWTPDTSRPGNQGAKASINEPVTTNSPLLFEMLKNLSATDQRTILDMGRASQSSIDFFGDYKCKLIITDAISELYKLDQKKNDTEATWLKALAKTIQYKQQQQTTLDFISLWSLPNYLSQHHLKALIQYLLPVTDSRTRLHAYIYNTLKMPAVPAHYHIKRNHKVVMSPQTHEQKNCPMYHLAELHNCFKPFKVDHAVMLSSGVQEYLFSV